MRATLPISPRRFVAAASMLTTPLLPGDYLGYLNPLWARREPRGVVAGVLPETADAATIWPDLVHSRRRRFRNRTLNRRLI
jgi:hypothetical protein